jgi:prophage antirepressor-like protein
MSDLPAIVHDVNGQSFTTYTYKDQPAWFVYDVAKAAGYAQPRRLADNIRGRWADEFEEGIEYVILTGAEADLLRGALHQIGVDPLPPSGPWAMLLFEPGLHLAYAKAQTEAGRAMRRFTTRTIIPQWRSMAATRAAIARPTYAALLALCESAGHSRPAELLRMSHRVYVAERESERARENRLASEAYRDGERERTQRYRASVTIQELREEVARQVRENERLRLAAKRKAKKSKR